jgi:hypothetical protein
VQGRRVGRDGVRQEGSVAATHRYAVAGKRDDRRVLAELDGVAVDDGERQQTPVDVNDARVEENRKFRLLLFKDSLHERNLEAFFSVKNARNSDSYLPWLLGIRATH